MRLSRLPCYIKSLSLRCAKAKAANSGLAVAGASARTKISSLPFGHCFDPNAFLAQAGIGRTVRRYRPKQPIFSQGDRANTVFYVQQKKFHRVLALGLSDTTAESRRDSSISSLLAGLAEDYGSRHKNDDDDQSLRLINLCNQPPSL
jgi:hypothetical protein